MSARQSAASEMGATAELTVASMPGRRGASWLYKSSISQLPTARFGEDISLTHLQSRMSCSKATKVFHMISYRFCSSTLSDVASSVGKGASAREVLVWLLPLVERALSLPCCSFAWSILLLPGLEPGILMGEALAGGGLKVVLSAGMFAVQNSCGVNWCG